MAPTTHPKRADDAGSGMADKAGRSGDRRTAHGGLSRDEPILTRQALAGLEPVGLADAPLFRAAMESAGRTGWKSYFPYLLCTSRPGRLVLYEQRGDILLVYHLLDGDRPRLNLLFPPAPWSDHALAWAEERLRSFNGSAAPKVELVEERDALRLVRRGYRIQLEQMEYIYDRAAVTAAEGPAFKSLRRHLSAAGQNRDLLLRPYEPGDEAGCVDVLRDWKARLRARGDAVDGYTLTRNCLQVAAGAPSDLLGGEVADLNGRIRGFAFGGPIAAGHGSVFIGISDPAVEGLAYLLRQRMMRSFPNLTYFNGSSDSGKPGLREIKMRFRPVDLSAIYRGRAEQ